MHYDYMSIDTDMPFVVAAQTYSYLKNLVPGLEVECDIDSTMKYLLNHGAEWTNPKQDNAPWYSPQISNSEHFYGGMVNEVRGLFDSTQTANFTELKSGGAVHNGRTFGVREIYVKMTLFSKGELSMSVGIDWLKETLSGGFCGPTGSRASCVGEDLMFLTSGLLGNSVSAVNRSFMDRAVMAKDVRVLQGLKVLRTVPFNSVNAVEVDFILIAASPFLFRLEEEWSVLASSATPHTEPEYKCDPSADSYAELITDPNDGAVSRPPRPPLINPLPMPSSWIRHDLYTPTVAHQKFGQTVIKATVQASNTQRMLRIRMYRIGNVTCDYDGEFLITYIPAGHTLVIDGTDNTIMMYRPGGKPPVPAANLVVGSDGRPAVWPVVDCKVQYRIQVDAPDSLTGIAVNVQGFLRR